MRRPWGLTPSALHSAMGGMYECTNCGHVVGYHPVGDTDRNSESCEKCVEEDWVNVK